MPARVGRRRGPPIGGNTARLEAVSGGMETPEDAGVRREVRAMRRRSARTPLFAIAAVAALSAAFAWVTTQPVLAPPLARSRVPRGTSERLAAEVRALSSFERDAAHPEGLERARAHVRAALEATGAHVEEQRFDVRGVSYANVLTHFGPDEGERIVVGAHYDTCGDHPGADDDASGVAGLVEIARRLAAEPPALRVDVVAFTLEEPPYFGTAHMGSLVHARSLVDAGVRVRAMIALEMIGTFSDEPRSQHFPSPVLGALYPDRGDFIAVVADLDRVGLVRDVKRAMIGASPLPVRSIDAPRTLVGIDFSDHRSYWASGFDAVMVTDTAFFRNAGYHTDADSPERLDYTRMAEVVEGVLAGIRAIATPT